MRIARKFLGVWRILSTCKGVKRGLLAVSNLSAARNSQTQARRSICTMHTHHINTTCALATPLLNALTTTLSKFSLI